MGGRGGSGPCLFGKLTSSSTMLFRLGGGGGPGERERETSLRSI